MVVVAAAAEASVAAEAADSDSAAPYLSPRGPEAEAGVATSAIAGAGTSARIDRSLNRRLVTPDPNRKSGAPVLAGAPDLFLRVEL